MKQIHFFGLKEDLLAMLEFLESQGPFKYVLTGNYVSDEIKNCVNVFTAGANIPNLGKATADQTAGCDTFLVCEPQSPVELRKFRAYDGRERICIDQLANPDSVVFTPGGMWSENVVLNGCVGTASDSQISRALMKRFHVAVKKTYSKVGAFYVGPKALVLLQNGKRLAGAVQSPPEFDLTLASVKG